MSSRPNTDSFLCMGRRFKDGELRQFWTRMNTQGQPEGESFAFAMPIANAHPGEVWSFVKNPDGAGWALDGNHTERPLFMHHHAQRLIVNVLFNDEFAAMIDYAVTAVIFARELARAETLMDIAGIVNSAQTQAQQVVNNRTIEAYCNRVGLHEGDHLLMTPEFMAFDKARGNDPAKLGLVLKVGMIRMADMDRNELVVIGDENGTGGVPLAIVQNMRLLWLQDIPF